MCGRFYLTTPPEVIAETFGMKITDELRAKLMPRFNIAPTQQVAVVRAPRQARDGGDASDAADGRASRDAASKADRELSMMRWGLIPSWVKTADEALSISARSINARAETAPDKPMFRQAFRRRRCLVPADGFYEWKQEGDAKRPMAITTRDERGRHRPFAFAGLWERWRDPEDDASPPVDSCTILTCAPNTLMRSIHDRMPVILGPGEYDRWLDPSTDDPEALRPLLDPYPDEQLSAFEISRFINNPKNEGPRCIEPVEGSGGGDGGLFG